MPGLPSKLLESLEEVYGPVASNFLIQQTPEGGASDYIKDQWIGVQLPVRERNLGHLATRYMDLLTGEFKDNNSPVPIAGVEAVHALLEADRFEAAKFWAPYQLGLFTFRAYEGELQSLER